MITRITGRLNRVLDEEARLQVGPLEYQVLVPEFIRRALQTRLDEEITLFTFHYFEGNPMQGKVLPRLIGFSSDVELDFFDLFCTVDKVGTRKALKALVRPIREIAAAIQREDAKWLTTLPGVGAATAETIVTTLKRKVTRFVHLGPGASENGEAGDKPLSVVDGNLVEDAYRSLLTLGMSPLEARNRLDKVLPTKRSWTSTQEILEGIFKTK